MKVTFLDAGREPKCPPDPAFPTGRDCDSSFGAERTCTVDIPYPAPRCGSMLVECPVCGLRAAITVAGRPDDPKTWKLPCNLDGATQ